MKRMKLEARSFLFATLMSCTAVFLFLLFIYSPYQHYKQLLSTNTTTQNALMEAQVKIAKLESENKVLTAANASLAIGKKELEQSVNNLRAQVERTQNDKESRAVAIGKKCFNQQLEFKQERIRVPPPKDMKSLLYANRIKLRMRLVPSETGRIKVYADANFNGFAEPIDFIKVGPTGGTDAEYEIHPLISQRTSITFIIYSANPFNVECIDKLPLL